MTYKNKITEINFTKWNELVKLLWKLNIISPLGNPMFLSQHFSFLRKSDKSNNLVNFEYKDLNQKSNSIFFAKVENDGFAIPP